jgi:hypothetical protein
MTTAAPVAEDLADALGQLGLRARSLVPISPPGDGKRGRCAYRAKLADGRTLKLRRLESAETAEQLVALRARLESAFAPVISRHGAVLIEEWIEGVPLSAAAAGPHLEAAGALLARHHLTDASGAPGVLETREWRALAEHQLESLAARGALAPGVVTSLRDELRRSDPGRAPAVLIHRDFCPENMLIDAAGNIRVFDNEWQALGPAGFDLGCTFSRWPMAEASQAAFAGAYRAAGGADPGPLSFWRIAAILWRARLRERRPPEWLASLLEPLRSTVLAGDAA